MDINHILLYVRTLQDHIPADTPRTRGFRILNRDISAYISRRRGKMSGKRDEWSNCVEQEGRCPIFGVKSGIPPVGLGALLILFATVSLYVHGLSPIYLPVLIIFTGFGLFLVWMGIAR
jgi:hypothetical protein